MFNRRIIITIEANEHSDYRHNEAQQKVEHGIILLQPQAEQ